MLKDTQTAYQRWELASFGDSRPSTVAARQQEEAVAAANAIPLPTQEMVDAIIQQAHDEGYREGQQAGYADGLAMGRAEAARELEHLQAIALTLGQAVGQAEESIANDVLELALQLAKGMLRSALEVKPELVLPVVREAISYLPVVQQPAQLFLNPADAQLVRDAMGEELAHNGWRIIEDAGIERGGCRLDTPSNQIDAQASLRWQRLTTALGKNAIEWLD